MKAKPLPAGGTIGVPAPSSPYDQRSEIDRGVRWWESRGYRVKLAAGIYEQDDYVAGDPAMRARDLEALFADPEVDAVQVLGGGYGASEVVPLLDHDVIDAHPKPFVGYSDITALHLWLMRCAQLRVFHGPTVDDLIPSARDPTMVSLLAALTTARPSAKIGRDMARAAKPGRAVGRLVGGNLSLVQQSIGTPYEVDTRGAILFLEETRDPMSVVDERLVHLRASGLLPQVRGIVFGQLSLDRSEEDEFEDFVLDLVSDLDVPVLMDFPAGHEVPNLTIPLGTEVEIVAEESTGWIVYREDALATPGSATDTATSPSAAPSAA
jgi:muramoyltetrapeptide carboxypeptidase